MKFFFLSVFFVSSAFAKPFTDERVYDHHLFPTEQACLSVQRGQMWMNCRQSVHFFPDGTATIIITDIINRASYVVDGRHVVIKAEDAGDMPKKISFTMDSTGRNLVTEEKEVWELELPERVSSPN